MLPYYVLIFIPIIFQNITFKRNILDSYEWKRRNNIAAKLFFIGLFFMLIFRHEVVGIDLAVYKYIFTFICDNNWITSLNRSPEIAWSFFNKLISIFTYDFRFIIIFASFFSIVFVYYAYKKYSNDISLTVVLYINMSCFVLLFSGLRQSIAISLGFIAFEMVRKKRIVSFLLVVTIAVLFHTSSFMLLFMYPLYYIKIKRKYLIWVVPLLIVIFIFHKPIFVFLGYVLNYFTDYNTDITLTGSYTMLILLIIFTIFAYVIPDELYMDLDTLGMRNFLVFSVIIQMFAPLHFLAMRMNYYYIVFIPILIPRIINYRRERWSQVAIVARHIMVVFFVIYFFVVAPKENVLNTFPYHFLWENI